MSMRYLIRRPKPEDFAELRGKVTNLDEQLGEAEEDFRRTVTVHVSPVRHLHYMLMTKKNGADWTWVCPSLELDAEDEIGLLALCEAQGIPFPAHIPNPRTYGT